MSKLVNKLFKKLGYLPINDVVKPSMPSYVVHTLDYIPVECREVVNIVNWVDDRFKEHAKDYVRKALAKEIIKYIDVTVYGSYNHPYEVELRAKLFVSKGENKTPLKEGE